jgi:hypothetical protein
MQVMFTKKEPPRWLLDIPNTSQQSIPGPGRWLPRWSIWTFSCEGHLRAGKFLLPSIPRQASFGWRYAMRVARCSEWNGTGPSGVLVL